MTSRTTKTQTKKILHLRCQGTLCPTNPFSLSPDSSTRFRPLFVLSPSTDTKMTSTRSCRSLIDAGANTAEDLDLRPWQGATPHGDGALSRSYHPLATALRHPADSWEPTTSPPISPSGGADPRSQDEGYDFCEGYGQYIYWEEYTDYTRRRALW